MDLEIIILSKISRTEKVKNHYDLTDTWDIKQKATNKTNIHTKLIDTDTVGWLPEGRGVGDGGRG